MKEDLENKVMKEIKTGRVKLRSKYIFLAEKLGLGSGLILTVLLAILFFNLILFYLKETDSLIYLTFGTGGLLPFLESFPYLLVVLFIGIIFLAGFLIKKTDFSYKKSFGELAVYFICFVILAVAVLVVFNLDNNFKKHQGEFIHPFFESRFPLKNGMAGTIVQKNENILILNTSEGLKSVNSKYVSNIDLKEGDFIVAIGKDEQGEFFAKDIRIINREGQMNFMREKLLPQPDILDKNCMEECFDEHLSPPECVEKCR